MLADGISRRFASAGELPWKCTHSAETRACPSTATPRHTTQACTSFSSSLGIGLEFRVCVVTAVSPSRKQHHRRAKNRLQSRDKGQLQGDSIMLCGHIRTSSPARADLRHLSSWGCVSDEATPWLMFLEVACASEV